MTQAIEFVLRERGFRAGRHRVAYQSCDDSVASTALFDEAKCAANARAYAQNVNVVGVIGTMNFALRCRGGSGAQPRRRRVLSRWSRLSTASSG